MRTLVVTSFLLLSLAGATAAAWAEDASVPVLLQQARELYLKDRYPEAIDAYRKVVQKDPASVVAWTALGLIYGYQNQLDASLDAYGKALQLKPGDADIRVGMARVLLWRGKYAEAEQAFRAVLQDHPDHKEAREGLTATLRTVVPDLVQAAVELYDADRYPEAIVAYRKVLQVDPDNVDAWRQLGAVCSYQDQFDESVKAYQKVLQLRPGDDGARLQIARGTAWRGRYAEAEQMYRGILQARPDDRAALLGLAATLTWHDRFTPAVAIYDQLLRKDPKDEAALLGKAEVLGWSGRLKEAEQAYRVILKEHPQDPKARLGLARVTEWRDLLEDAALAYQQMLEDPKPPFGAYAGLGRVRHFQGLDREAIPLLQKAVTGDRSGTDTRRFLHNVQQEHRPFVEPLYSYYRDSDANTSTTFGAAAGFDIDRQTRFNVAWTHAHENNSNLGLSGTSNLVEASVRAQVNRVLAVTPRVGVATMDSSGVSHDAGVVGGLNIEITPDALNTIQLDLSREAVADTPQLLQNHVYASTGSLGWTHHLGPDDVLYLTYMRSTFSDHNNRNIYFGAIAHRLRQSRPHAEVGLRYRQMDFSKESGEGYFNPPHYHIAELFAGVDQDDPNERFIYALDGGLGYQRVNLEKSQLVSRLRALLGYRLSDDVTVEVAGETSNAAASTAAGFSYRSITARVRVKF